MPLELPDGWRDQLPEDIRENGVLDDVKSIDQMATMIVHGRKLQSKQISIPGVDAAPETRTAFLKDLQDKVPDLVYVGEGADLNPIYDRMGRPTDSTGYELPEIPDPLKDNFANLVAKGHELGVNKTQMKGLSEMILSDYSANAGKHASDRDATVNEVKTKFGEAFTDKAKAAAGFAKQLGFDDSLVAAIQEGTVGLENMEAFDKLMGGYKSPGPRIGDDPGGQEFDHLTPAQAELQLNEIMSNKEHPYWDGSNPAHKAAIAKVVELTRAADAGKPLSDGEKFRDALMGRG